MASYDVTVMGAGVFGLSCAWAMVQRGAKVQVIDPFGVGAGASGGVVGALAPHVPDQWNPKKQFQLDALLMAERYWAEVAVVGGLDSGYARLGRIQPLADAHAVDLARARVAGAEQLWGDAAIWRVEALAGGPWGVTSPTGLAVFDSLTARIAPLRAVHALAAAIVAKGGVIAADGVATGAVVWATGYAGLQDLTLAMGRSAGGGVKGQAAVFALDLRDQPQLFTDALHVVPHADGTTAIGSTSENAWDDDTATDDQLDALIAKARALVPVLADAQVTSRWAGVRPKARSRAPLLAAHPLQPGVFVANGGFKIGFGVAPMVGKVMADLVLEGVDNIPAGFGF
ncbi:oxidoreductase, FAD-binding protein [Ketogulonicigenium robustum]|uniref:Oxidoreductase, FAD-binding protein n=1 Tax=Ketogulonicigenium robustum TaxID=92947 RepID=A0A1W6NX41_9RHOB|nr:FAD-binding oxidoreductase [Ketogulonicigenium robustum]ARO13577.1 oxidoreductase, FAD-binding protein [Ketogulonicigenium robustum]